MTVTLALTTEQELRLQQTAQVRGMDAEALLGQMVDGAIEQLEPVAAPPQARVLGLHAGQTWMSDDFDDPLPDSFWTGSNG